MLRVPSQNPFRVEQLERNELGLFNSTQATIQESWGNRSSLEPNVSGYSRILVFEKVQLIATLQH